MSYAIINCVIILFYWLSYFHHLSYHIPVILSFIRDLLCWFRRCSHSHDFFCTADYIYRLNWSVNVTRDTIGNVHALCQELLYLYVVSKFLGLRVMVFNATFNNISVISWQPVFLIEEDENHWITASHGQTLSHHVVSSTPRHERDSNSQRQWC